MHITSRSAESEAARKEHYKQIYAPAHERRKQAKTDSATEAQVKHLTTLAERVGKERFDAEFTKVIKGSGSAPRAPRQRARRPRNG
ncbi:hypothetical protein [Streptomyces sp. NPDC102360]|uniref:hypothetical protein n=1 Tax=Streptomyces sp. NPDC102360 TaxID=3366160 RepID=UPI00382A40AE